MEPLSRPNPAPVLSRRRCSFADDQDPRRNRKIERLIQAAGASIDDETRARLRRSSPASFPKQGGPRRRKVCFSAGGAPTSEAIGKS